MLGPEHGITRDRMMDDHDTDHPLLVQLGPALPATACSARELVGLACRLAEADLADLGEDKKR